VSQKHASRTSAGSCLPGGTRAAGPTARAKGPTDAPDVLRTARREGPRAGNDGIGGRCVLDRTFKAIPEEPNDAAHGPRLGRAPAHRTVAGLLRRCDAARGCAMLGSPDLTTSRVYHGVTSDQPYDRTLEVLRASDLEVIETERGMA
jgi:hypothetical protein